ncbi:MAG: hypothetical protein ACYCYQ_04240, partial [Acidimicrobiales bacterium]
APDRCLTNEFRSVTTTRGERNRFYLTATFADRETRESVSAHSYPHDRSTTSGGMLVPAELEPWHTG